MLAVEKKPYIHLSVDDTFEIFKDLARNAMYYSSIFENPYLHFLEMLHTQYGLVASMYCFTEEGDFSLSNVPDIFCPDFTKSADWLKWGFHGRSRNSRYQYACGRKAQKDYSFAIRELLRITGSARCIDVAPRLHFFAGTWECIRAMCQSDHGLKGLFSADDDRLSYYLDATQSKLLKDYGLYYDQTMELFFFSTDIRLENIQSIAKERANMEYCLFEKGRKNNGLHVFTHENRLANEEICQKIIDLCVFAQERSIPFAFPLQQEGGITMPENERM